MKKIFIGLVLSSVFIAPSVSFAQVADPAPVDQAVLIQSLRQQIIQLLLQEIAILKQQLADLQAAQGTPQVVQGIGAPTENVQIATTCVQHPTLTLSEENRGKVTNDPYENRYGVYFKGKYATGCPIDSSVSWDFKSADWNNRGDTQHYNYGTLQNGAWSVQDTIAYFNYSGTYTDSNTFTLTVGDVVATTSVIIQ